MAKIGISGVLNTVSGDEDLLDSIFVIEEAILGTAGIAGTERKDWADGA